MRVLTTCLLLVLLLVIAACSEKPAGTFTPLIQPGPAGHYDLIAENVSSVRGAELAPGAQPAKPVIDGRTARKTAHFITTHSGEVSPLEVGTEITDGLEKVEFLSARNLKNNWTDGSFEATFEYEFPGGRGTLKLELSVVDAPNRLDLRYEVAEELE